MPTPINPYVAGNPVGDSPAFIGRADVLREVLRVLRRPPPSGNAIVLYGQRRIGKTSILQHLKAQLPKQGSYCAVYFDLQDKAAWPLGQVLRDLARTIAHTLSQPDPDLGDDPETAFRQTWLRALLSDLPEGCSLVLLLDEFDVLADPKAEQAATAFFPYLRGLLTSDPRKLKFIFVIGRNINDLTNIALSLFKGIPSRRISLLGREDTADLVCLSQKNGTLNWPDNAVERVWQLTHGHPFLTQQLCSHIWERTYDQEPDESPVVTLTDVGAAVPDALEACRNMLEWLWDGLPPAERVVISAPAEAGPGPISGEELERLLRESGVRVLIRELRNAPQLLQDWDLIEPADGSYSLRVELLRQWIAKHKPWRGVQEQLDRIEPVADGLYQAASGFYRGGQLEQAAGLLRQVIGLNPNHIGANELLADILVAQGRVSEAQRLLEVLYEYQPAIARPRLVEILLDRRRKAEAVGDFGSAREADEILREIAPQEVANHQEITTLGRFYFRNRYFLTGDLILILVATLLSFYARLDVSAWEKYRPSMFIYMAIVLGIKPIVFHLFGLYQRYWPYASIGEVVTIVGANLTATLTEIVFAYLLVPIFVVFEPVPRSIPFIDFLLTTAGVGGTRFLVRLLYQARVRRTL